ncbi:ABC transporter ATP-binding protein, partial [Anaerococcus vaginalis]|uniref:ABC transporter ATP-binding protein n=1 Tax=Anaerococcus vaginalis TaxID=33037 RepID=UPI002913BDB9
HKKLVKNSSAYYTKNGIYVGLMNVFSNFSILVSLFFLVVKLIEKSISLADFTLYFNSLISLINASKEIQKNYAQVIAFNEQLQSLFDFLNQKEENFDEGKIKKINTEKITIKFDNVSFKYPKSKENILENCSFEIKNGETVALVGKNGAGKSTIVKLLCKFYKPTKGNIYLNEININDIDTKTYYKILSPTFQDFRLFPFRISENISANLLDEITKYQREKMDESFYLLNLKSWIDKLVNKEDTFLTFLFSNNSVEPSGGIGQKLALSRSIVHEGKFFIMDEPTSALDPRSEQEIFEKMLDISKGQTSLFISHRLSSTKYADRIIVCDNKKITENGNHEKLMKDDGLYKKMYLSQAKLYD